MKRLIATTIMVLGLIVVGILSPAPAWATDKYFCATADNTWSGANWKVFAAGEDCTTGTATDPPTAADRAIIVGGKTCNVDVTTAAADSLNVESGATLNIQASKKLTIDDTAATGTTIGGTLNLQGASSELAFVDNDQTIDGAGKIVGQNSASKITVVSGKILTNESTIEGALKITGPSSKTGTFLNHGTVHANSAGTLEISTDALGDDSTAAWKITTSSNAVLRIDVFSSTRPALDGDWTIEDDGKLDVDSVGFTTTGSLVWKGGTIDVASNSLADFGWFADP